MASEPQQTQPNLILVLVIGAVVFFSSRGCEPSGPVQPVDPVPTTDLVSDFFDKSESAFRELQGRKASKLRAGEFSNETESVKWFEAEFLSARKSAVQPLVEYEYEQFGGDKWTAESEAAIADRWAKGGAK